MVYAETERVLTSTSLILNLMVWFARIISIDLLTISLRTYTYILDHETARYLLESMPALRKIDESEVMDQLLQARQKKSSKSMIASSGTPTSTCENSFEATVADAMAALTSAG